MALWQSKPKVQVKTGNNSEPITLDGGLNRHGTIFNIGKNEAWDCINTTSKVNGALSVRPADTDKITKIPDGTSQFSDVHGILGINSYVINYEPSAGVAIINLLVNDPDNPTQYYVLRWNPPSNMFWSKSYPLTSDKESTIITLQTGTDEYTIVCNTQGVYETHDGDEELPQGYNQISNAPKTHIYTVDDNRLFALEGNKLSWCDPTDITNWTTGESGNITITEMRGEGSALITMNDAVYCFSGRSLHILYGDDTGNYALSNTIDVGCVGFRALAKYNDSIYFLDYDGLKVYSNGVINSISDKISYWIKNPLYSNLLSKAAMAINEDYLYLSLRSSTPNMDITVELNLKTGVFNLWDEAYNAFTKSGKILYGVKAKGTGLVEIGTKTNHSKEWYYETPMKFLGFNKQIVSSIPIVVDLPIGSTLKLAFNTNPNTPSWKDIYTFISSSNVQRVVVDIPMTDLNNVDWYQLKLSGTGPCIVHYMGTDERVRIR